MKIVEKNINDIFMYEKNPRRNDEAVEYVANSISEFGFKVPVIIDINNIIIAGHTRYKAAKLLGLDVIPCIIADDLSEEQVKAFRLADNKVAEIAEWDFELLNKELAEIVSLDMTMFDFDISNIDFYKEDNDTNSDNTEITNNSYNIIYELVFNNEDEQSKWFEFLRYLKAEYTDLDTISERVLRFIEEARK